MAGIIDKAQATPAEGGKIDPAGIRAQIQVPPDMQDAYQRVVVAGGKFMFDERTHEQAIKGLEGEGPIGDRLGAAIANLMQLLFMQSNKTMPPQVILPAGVDLLSQAAAFIQDAKIEPITAKDLGRAMVVMISSLTKMFGGDASKLEAAAGGAMPEGEGPEGPAHEAAPGDAQEDAAEGEPADTGEPGQEAWDEEAAMRKGA